MRYLRLALLGLMAVAAFGTMGSMLVGCSENSGSHYYHDGYYTGYNDDRWERNFYYNDSGYRPDWYADGYPRSYNYYHADEGYRAGSPYHGDDVYHGSAYHGDSKGNYGSHESGGHGGHR